MNWALVLGLLLMCGTVLATEDYGLRETNSEETEDELLRELENDFLMLSDEADVCTDELKKFCENINANCIPDTNEENDKENIEKKATCECTETGKKFDGLQCAVACGNKFCQNGATTCNENVCSCPDGTSGDDCGVITGCTEEFKKNCTKINTECIYDPTAKNKATCKCEKANTKFDGEKCSVACGNHFCQNGATTCNENVCSCPDGTSGDDCGVITGCTEEFKKNCTKINTECIYDPTAKNKATCKCEKANTKFDGEKCSVACGNHFCQNGATTCNENVCSCPDGTSGDDCGVITGCTEEFKKNCTKINTECIYDPTAKNKATCKCEKANTKFDGEKCSVACGNHFCQNGATTCNENVCSCPDGTSGDDCGVITGCTEEFKKNCTKINTECVYDPTAKNKATCKCEKANTKFDGEKCSVACDNKFCQNGATTCNENVCSCPDGTSGDDCGIITGCTEEFKKNCTKINTECIYDPTAKNKATCKCEKADTKFDGQQCSVACGDKFCKNGATTCNDGGLTCKCPEGTSGDDCGDVTGCTDDLKTKCTAISSECIYDPEAAGKATCKCEKPSEKFDGKKCSVFCGSKFCQNGATKCKGQTCECPEGTSGDDCGVATGCTDEFKKKCTDIRAECIYDSSAENKATCKCKNPDEKFDGKNCSMACGDKFCKNGATTCNDGGLTCKCPKGTSGDDCGDVTGCTDDLKTKCTAISSECIYDPEAAGKATCKCEKPSEKFDGKKCSVFCGSKFCQNGATKCKGQTCECPEGTSGDDCGVATGCTDEFKKKCTDIRAECIYDSSAENKATCKCKNPDEKFDGKNCSMACGDKFCKNGATTCNDGGLTCKCPKGTSGDDCGDVTGCTDDLKTKCTAISSECIYDPEAAGKATCKCEKPSEKFDGKKCSVFCGSKFCQNGATKCKGQTCECPEGTSGDDCGVATGCTDEFKKKCTDIRAECIYDSSAENKATCKCKNPDEKFDGKNCSSPCSSNPCQNGGECSVSGENFKCKCKSPYSGENCEISPCSPSPCQNDGECSVLGETFKCKCKHPYIGDICDKECDCGDKGTCSFDKEGNKKCDCNSKYAEKDGKCQECDCGNQGTCMFKDGNKKCACPEKYAEKDGKCEVCDCGKNGECYFDGDPKAKKCKCKAKYVEDKGTCQLCNCGEHGVCSFKEGKKYCECSSGYATKNGECHETCDPKSSHCEHKGTCDYVEGSNNFCKCSQYFRGDRCEKIVACVDGEYKDCEKTGGKCILADNKDNKAECVCEDPKKLDKNICRNKCGKDECKNTGTCVDELCKCPEGTSGDDCSKVIGCDETLTKKCEDGGATCVYQDPANKAVCKCKDNVNFEFVGDKCLPKWCKGNPCKEPSNCTFSNGAGRCECNKGEYYDYLKEKCIDINKCPTKPCGENRVCENGVCVCAPNYKEVGKDDKKECQRKTICREKSSDPCYKDANCTEGDVPGSVKCECQSNFYYDQGTKTCLDGKCFLPGSRKECKTCPGGKFEKKEDGSCVAKVEKERCSKDCGAFGYCLKIGEKDTCVCVEKAMNENGTETKCVLDAQKACASGKLLANKLKCECSGNYKQSKNGITCELKTCGDEDAQKDCKNKGGYCEDKLVYGKRNGYMCTCRSGYSMTDAGCIDACNDKKQIESCSKQQKVCYKNEQGIGECKCPPGFTEKTNGEKKTCEPIAQNAYLIQSLPVQSDRYKESNSFDAVKLNRDIIQSMKTIYKNLQFSSLQQYRTSDDGKVLLCDVWLQFAGEASNTIKRWKTEAVEEEQSLILPPALYLNKDQLANTKDEQLNFCSKTVSLMACGEGTKCADNKCSCDAGFRVIGPTVQEEAGRTILRCADIDECQENLDKCNKKNSKCVNKPGSYYCSCLPGFHRNESESDESQAECFGLCTPNPCGTGDCKVDDKYRVECSCKIGYKGSFCSQEDEALKKAQHNTTVVGAVLGTLLALTFLAIVVYIVKQRKNSYSEDFAPAPRDNAEMVERNRPLRGVSNRGYQ